MAVTEFGELLNTIDHLITPCPRGHIEDRLYVYERAARWSCGKVEWLPPLAVQGRKAKR